MKPLFYVPIVLVIRTDDEGSADAEVENMLDGLMKLQPAVCDGYTLVPGLDTSLASTNWVNVDQDLNIDDGRVTIKEVRS